MGALAKIGEYLSPVAFFATHPKDLGFLSPIATIAKLGEKKPAPTPTQPSQPVSNSALGRTLYPDANQGLGTISGSKSLLGQ